MVNWQCAATKLDMDQATGYTKHDLVMHRKLVFIP